LTIKEGTAMWQWVAAWWQLGKLSKTLNATADAIEARQREAANAVTIDVEVVVEDDSRPADVPDLVTVQAETIMLTAELLWLLEHGDLDPARRQAFEHELSLLNPAAWREYLASRPG